MSTVGGGGERRRRDCRRVRRAHGESGRRWRVRGGDLPEGSVTGLREAEGVGRAPVFGWGGRPGGAAVYGGKLRRGGDVAAKRAGKKSRGRAVAWLNRAGETGRSRAGRGLCRNGAGKYVGKIERRARGESGRRRLGRYGRICGNMRRGAGLRGFVLSAYQGRLVSK